MSYMDRRHIDERFDWERDSDYETFIWCDLLSMAEDCYRLDVIVDQVYADCEMSSRKEYKYEGSRLSAVMQDKKNIRFILWHLTQAAKVESDCYAVISLSTNHYKASPVENPHGITKDISSILKLMQKKGFIEKVDGFYDRKTGKSRYTLFRAAMALVVKLQVLPPQLKEMPSIKPPIKFKTRKSKDEKSKVITPSPRANDDADVIDVLDVVPAFNKRITRHKIRLSGHSTKNFRWLDGNDKVQVTNLDRIFLTATVLVEKDGSLSYFRKHGAFWQDMPGEFRDRVLIDGMPTVLLDYSAQILNIAASRHGKQLPDCGYMIDVGLNHLPENVRKTVVKDAIVVMMNTTTKESVFNTLRSILVKDGSLKRFGIKLTDKFLSSILDKIFLHYSFLQDVAFRDIGVTYFREDAAIAREIMRCFMDADKIVLPIHDGFIAKQEEYQFLLDTMNNVWYDRYGTTIPIKQEG